MDKLCLWDQKDMIRRWPQGSRRGSQTVIRVCEVMYLLQLLAPDPPVLFPADVLTKQIFFAWHLFCCPLCREGTAPLPSPLCLVSLIMESSN